MALTPSIQDSQGRVLATAKVTSSTENVIQARTFGVYNVPTPVMQSEQARVNVVDKTNTTIQASQAFVMGVVRGRIDNFNLRAYTVTVDGHDWYILQCGEGGTLVYDCLTQQWMSWDNLPRDINNFRGDCGINWNAVSNFNSQSDVVIGDDITGMVWYFNEYQQYDGDAYNPATTTVTKFTRAVTGGLPNRGRGSIPCNFVFLTSELGYGLIGSTVTLNVSDDLGQTYVNCGSIVNTNDFSQDATWMSLGSFGAPGRIFQVTDDGFTGRIDSLDMA